MLVQKLKYWVYLYAEQIIYLICTIIDRIW